MKTGDNFSLSFDITSKLHQGFIETFNDRNPMHVDNEFAQRHGFKEKVMHGNILGGFISNFVGEHLDTKDVIILSQKISYHKPFFIEDTITLNAKITEIFESVKMVDFKLRFTNQNDEMIAKGNLQIKLL